MPATKSDTNVHKLLLKATMILEEIAEKSSKATIQSLSRHFQLSYTSTYRIVQTFLHVGWIRQAEDGDLSIAPELTKRLDTEQRQSLLLQQLRPLIDRIRSETGLTTKLSVRSGHEAVSIYRAQSERPTAIHSQPGARYHLAAGSSGATLLSGCSQTEIQSILKTAPDHYWKHQTRRDVLGRIEQVTTNGYCIDQGQFNPDIHTVSIPLQDEKGHPKAAITVLGFPSDLAPATLPNIVKSLQKAVRKTSL